MNKEQEKYYQEECNVWIAKTMVFGDSDDFKSTIQTITRGTSSDEVPLDYGIGPILSMFISEEKPNHIGFLRMYLFARLKHMSINMSDLRISINTTQQELVYFAFSYGHLTLVRYSILPNANGDYLVSIYINNKCHQTIVLPADDIFDLIYATYHLGSNPKVLKLVGDVATITGLSYDIEN